MSTTPQVQLDPEAPTGRLALARRAPRPRTLEQTGLGHELVQDLLLKHLFAAGAVELTELSRRLALAGTVLEPLLDFMRGEGLVEVRGPALGQAGIRFGLTQRGRGSALDALARDGYTGPAPVPLALYEQVVREQTVHQCRTTRARIREALSDVVLPQSMLDRLGPAVHSGKAIFVYGHAGTGKTFVCRRLMRLLDGAVLVPHAIAIGQFTIQYFDPAVHRPVSLPDTGSASHWSEAPDPRFAVCERPVVIAGGELTLEMLELQYEPNRREYRAPLQMRANNGMFLIDDLGRQRVQPYELLNRWIVPMEEQKDYLHLSAGEHFSVPFDTVLIFSTNMDPNELADEAFLRRIGHKVRFDHLGPDDYRAIWRQTCESQGLEYDASLADFVIESLHREQQVPLLPCHPRDLIGLALDYRRYAGGQEGLSVEGMRWAWDNYFVRLQ